MNESKYSYNVNKNTIEADGKCVAYVNVVDVDRIIFLLNWQNELIKDLEEENERLKSKVVLYERNLFH